jgi:hypothetical protein
LAYALEGGYHGNAVGRECSFGPDACDTLSYSSKERTRRSDIPDTISH